MTLALAPPVLQILTIDFSGDQSDAQLAGTLLEALNTVGFLHVLNPGDGLTAKKVREIFSSADQLFQLPLADKENVGFNIETGEGQVEPLNAADISVTPGCLVRR
ncbi:hypothetical protein P7C73_g788, partial [Tremellales sp. Uapishka_1]